jgi:UDP-N-acetylglucosamine--N-acetylmuramyl-(pentapeptide) pyrophosphoryl-undecaprenol N-acetylglucosamine transferase
VPVAKDTYIVFAGGGTGGHLFPALAVAERMRVARPGASIEFVGGTRGLETRLVPQAGFPLRTLPLSGLKGGTIGARVVALLAAASGVLRCGAWFVRHRPDLVVGVGGYASGPAVLAAWLLRVPTMLMEQNHFPGATNRWLAPRASAVCVPSEAAKARLHGVGLVTGNPVRPEFASIGPPPGAARLSLLVFGGSRGARSINRAIVAALPRLAAMTPPPRVVHQTGPDEYEAVARAFAGHPGLDTEVLPFLDDMPARLAAADLVVCRAGATTLSELAAAGRPAILVPLPFAADDHQRANAEAVRDAGAAVVVEDRELDGGRCAAEIAALAADRDRRARMAAAARTLARPDAAAAIVRVADALLDGREVTHVP